MLKIRKTLIISKFSHQHPMLKKTIQILKIFFKTKILTLLLKIKC